MVRVTLPRTEKREPKVLEKSLLEWFLSGVEGHEWLYTLFVLDAATGCRRGELLALTGPDINWDTRDLYISEALAQTRANEHRAIFANDYRTDLNLVFCTLDGDYLKPNSVTAKVSLMARKLGFPKGISLHMLRHTHGSQLLSAGVPLPAVPKRLGACEHTHYCDGVFSRVRTRGPSGIRCLGKSHGRSDSRHGPEASVRKSLLTSLEDGSANGNRTRRLSVQFGSVGSK
jgi:integrase